MKWLEEFMAYPPLFKFSGIVQFNQSLLTYILSIQNQIEIAKAQDLSLINPFLLIQLEFPCTLGAKGNHNSLLLLKQGCLSSWA